MQWEYLVQNFDSGEVFSDGSVSPRDFQKLLQRHGAEGWELVTMLKTENGFLVLTFKRDDAGIAVRSTR